MMLNRFIRFENKKLATAIRKQKNDFIASSHIFFIIIYKGLFYFSKNTKVVGIQHDLFAIAKLLEIMIKLNDVV